MFVLGFRFVIQVTFVGLQYFREKNSDFIRQDIMLVLKNSSLSFVRELVGMYTKNCLECLPIYNPNETKRIFVVSGKLYNNF